MLYQIRIFSSFILLCMAISFFAMGLVTYEFGLSTFAGGIPLSSQEEIKAKMLLLTSLLCVGMAGLLFVFKKDAFWLGMGSIIFAIIYLFLCVLAIGYGNSYNSDFGNVINTGIQDFGSEGTVAVLVLLLLSPLLGTITYLTYNTKNN